MSKSAPVRALTPSAIRARKGGEPIVCLTAYTTPTARLMDAEVDLILVGDSLGMVIYGMSSTVGVTLDMMVAHGQAVMRGSAHACVVVDLPFGTYEESPAQAFRSAARVMSETGCAAVKLEGGNEAEAEGIMADAVAVAEAGAFGIVIEKTMEELSGEITRRVPIPTIGIGASVSCDGQILVTDDVVGMFPDFRPKFVKRYAMLGDAYAEAVRGYAADVRARRFPGPDQVFSASAGRK